MKSLWKWGMLGVFSLSLMMGTTACSDDDPDYSNVTPPEVASVASTIGGIVSDRSGDAIAGAKVTLTGSSSKSTQTGDDGVYLFEEVTPGTYTVLVEADGKVSEEGTVTVANSEQTQSYIWNVSLNADQEEQIAVSVTDETSGSVNTETLKGNEIAGVEMTAVVPADAVTGVEEGEEVVISMKPVYTIAAAERMARAEAETMLAGTELSCNVEGATLQEPVQLRFSMGEAVANSADIRKYKGGQWSTVSYTIDGNDIVVEADEFAIYGVFLGISYTISESEEPISFTQSVWDNLYGSQEMTVGSVTYTFKIGTEITTTASDKLTGLLIEKLAQLYATSATTVTRTYPLDLTLPIGTKLEISGSHKVTTASISGLGCTATIKQYGDVTISAYTSNRSHTGGSN